MSGSSYDLGGPWVASDGTDVFADALVQPVAAKHSVPWGVTEIDASNGDVVRTLSGPSYGFADPATINAEGANLGVWNLSVGTLTEFPTDAS